MASSSRLVLLIDVDSPYRETLREAAERRRLQLLCMDGETLPDRIIGDVAVCVVQKHGSDAAFCRWLRGLRGVVPGNLAVLCRRIRLETVLQLSHVGVSDVIELPAAPLEVADRCLGPLAGEKTGPARDDGIDAAGATRCIVGRCASIRGLRREVRRVAPREATVLLVGETGTGKGLVARAVHQASERREGPFVHVDCAALSPSVIESELFGHERGAFTGALQSRPGRFEVAAEGTIFLDEIGELDTGLQSKFLRVLEDRSFERVGSTKAKPMRARVLVATSRDLRSEIRRGRFRADLYFRINVFPLRIPPLRSRLDDLPDLVEAGLARIAPRVGVAVPRVRDDFIRRLEGYSWPGNVRELMNLLERLVIRHPGSPLDAQCLDEFLSDSSTTGELHLPSREGCDAAAPDAGASAGESEEVDELARHLAAAGGNVARAARRLGMPPSTLRSKIDRYGLRKLIPRD